MSGTRPKTQPVPAIAFSSENIFETAFENAPDGLIIADGQGRLLAMNAVALRTYGFRTVRQAQQESGRWDARCVVYDREGLKVPLQQWPLHRALSGEILSDSEVRIHNVDTREDLWVTHSSRTISDSNGKPSRIIISIHDITELRRDLTAALQDQLRCKAQDLALANHELETFSYSVSHDLRNPLHAVEAFIDLLLCECGDALGENGNQYLGMIRKQTQRMGQIITDMLKLSRLWRKDLLLKDIDLTALASHVADELRQTQPDRKVDIRIQQGLSARGDEWAHPSGDRGPSGECMEIYAEPIGRPHRILHDGKGQRADLLYPR